MRSRPETKRLPDRARSAALRRAHANGSSAWSNRPKWVEAVLAVALGWIGVVVLPQLVETVGLTAVGLVLAGGLFYTAGSLVYVRRRPDPIPAVFGYHELFHALVVVAAACQYAAIASFVL